MDIQKERELFEAWVIENLADGRSMSWEDWCWKSWQAAKASVIEGFVLVPKEPTLEMCHRGRNTRSFKVQDIYKAMIEAQEPSNEH